MENILEHYNSLKNAIDSESLEEAGQHLAQLDQSIRQFFAAPHELSDSQQKQLAEISKFLSESCDNMIADRAEVGTELAGFSKAKEMKKAYGKL